MSAEPQSLWIEEIPPYVRPSMADVRAIPWNGLTCVGSFSGCGGSSLGLRMAGWKVPYAIEFVPAAADTYEVNSDAYVDRRDVRKIRGSEILDRLGLFRGELDLFEGSPPCFPAGTLILTESGQRPIDEIQEGDRVLTHEGRWRPVTETYRRRYYGRLLSLSMKYRSEPLSCTTDHPFLVRRRESRSPRRFREPEWLAASEIRPGDALLVPAVKEAPERPNFDVSSLEGRRDWHDRGIATRFMTHRANRVVVDSPDTARLLGLYLAEGWRRGRAPDVDQPGTTRREVIFAAAPKEVEYTQELIRRVGLRGKEVVREDRTARKVHVTSTDLWTICEEFGDGALRKRIPEWVFGMPDDWRAALLEGYCHGDGHVTSSGRHLAGTISPELALGVCRLVQDTHRVAASIKRRDARPWSIDGRTGLSHDPWIVGWSPSSASTKRTAALVDDWGTWIPVRAIEDGGPEEWVYNLEVEEDHSYVAGTVATHNCSSFSSAGNREKSWGQEKKYSDTKQRTDDLFWEYARLLKELNPRAFVAENVPGLVMGGAVTEYAHKISLDLSRLGYHVQARVMNAANFGVPQERKRLIFVGLRNDVAGQWEYPPPTTPVPHTTRQALESVDPEDPDHAPYVEESSMEGYAVAHTWRALVERGARREAHGDRNAIPPLEDFCRRCGKRLEEHEVHKRDNRHRVLKATCENGEAATITKDYFMFQIPELDRPCPTLTATGSSVGAASVVHPTECRKMTPAEAKAICGFPADFVLTGARQQRYERMGRAVPPPLYAAVGRRLAEILACP